MEEKTIAARTKLSLPLSLQLLRKNYCTSFQAVRKIDRKMIVWGVSN